MISCWYYRKVISNSVDDNAALPDGAQAHVANCPGCREHYESETHIARQLSAGAAVQEAAKSSPFLHGKIMAAVANPHSKTAPDPAGRLGWWLAWGTACVLVAGILWLRSRPAVEGPGPVASASGTESRAVSSLEKPIPLAEWAAKLDEPLETEMKLVLNDTKTAMNSLANNFLPGEVRSALFQQMQN